MSPTSGGPLAIRPRYALLDTGPTPTALPTGPCICCCALSVAGIRPSLRCCMLSGRDRMFWAEQLARSLRNMRPCLDCMISIGHMRVFLGPHPRGPSGCLQGTWMLYHRDTGSEPHALPRHQRGGLLRGVRRPAPQAALKGGPLPCTRGEPGESNARDVGVEPVAGASGGPLHCARSGPVSSGARSTSEPSGWPALRRATGRCIAER
jgi:hypothetical protein